MSFVKKYFLFIIFCNFTFLCGMEKDVIEGRAPLCTLAGSNSEHEKSNMIFHAGPNRPNLAGSQNPFPQQRRNQTNYSNKVPVRLADGTVTLLDITHPALAPQLQQFLSQCADINQFGNLTPEIQGSELGQKKLGELVQNLTLKEIRQLPEYMKKYDLVKAKEAKLNDDAVIGPIAAKITDGIGYMAREGLRRQQLAKQQELQNSAAQAAAQNNATAQKPQEPKFESQSDQDAYEELSRMAKKEIEPAQAKKVETAQQVAQQQIAEKQAKVTKTEQQAPQDFGPVFVLSGHKPVDYHNLPPRFQDAVNKYIAQNYENLDFGELQKLRDQVTQYYLKNPTILELYRIYERSQKISAEEELNQLFRQSAAQRFAEQSAQLPQSLDSAQRLHANEPEAQELIRANQTRIQKRIQLNALIRHYNAIRNNANLNRDDQLLVICAEINPNIFSELDHKNSQELLDSQQKYLDAQAYKTSLRAKVSSKLKNLWSYFSGSNNQPQQPNQPANPAQENRPEPNNPQEAVPAVQNNPEPEAQQNPVQEAAQAQENNPAQQDAPANLDQALQENTGAQNPDDYVMPARAAPIAKSKEAVQEDIALIPQLKKEHLERKEDPVNIIPYRPAVAQQARSDFSPYERAQAPDQDQPRNLLELMPQATDLMRRLKINPDLVLHQVETQEQFETQRDIVAMCNSAAILNNDPMLSTIYAFAETATRLNLGNNTEEASSVNQMCRALTDFTRGIAAGLYKSGTHMADPILHPVETIKSLGFIACKLADVCETFDLFEGPDPIFDPERFEEKLQRQIQYYRQFDQQAARASAFVQQASAKDWGEISGQLAGDFFVSPKIYGAAITAVVKNAKVEAALSKVKNLTLEKWEKLSPAAKVEIIAEAPHTGLLMESMETAKNSERIGKRIKKPIAMNMNEFFETVFGRKLKNKCRKIRGGQIYEISEKIDPILRKGDYIYLDKAHFDHIEVFDYTGNSKGVLNLDGTYNQIKSNMAKGRRINVK